MDILDKPERLKLTGNVDSNWRAFKQQLQLYIAAMGLEEKSEARKVALLLTMAGPQAIEVYNKSVNDEQGDKNKLDKVLEKFDAHCSPKKNDTYERYVFRARVQQQNEPFDSFLTDLKLKAQTCKFGTLRDSLIRDQIVFCVEDKKLRERLLRETQLTLDGATKICRASEVSQMQVKTFSHGGTHSTASVSDSDVCDISRGGKRRTQTRPAQQQVSDASFHCKRCASQHTPRQCPAFGKQCSNCHGGKNHFARQCFSKGKDKKKGKTVKVVDDSDQSDDLSDTFFVGMVNCEDEPEKRG